MSKHDSRGLRLKALAAATAIAITSTFATAAAAERINLGSLAGADQHDQFIVRYKQGTNERASVNAAKAKLNGAGRSVAAMARGKAIRIGHRKRISIGADVIRADRKLSDIEAEQLMREIAADPNVEYVEVDQLMKPLLTPNDTHYSQYLWGMQSGTGGMRADQAWDSADGTGVVVAVIDTGIAPHSDLNANILPGYDFISDASMARDGNGRDGNPNDEGDWYGANECGGLHAAADSSWHGTHVAGTVAAVGNNNSGVIGAAYKSKVVPVRVLGKCGGYTSDIVDGIAWASGGSVSGVPSNANPAEVINMSLGGSGSCSSTYQNAINAAVGRGSTVVVAAGNSNANVSGFSPASCSNVVSVAATNKTGGRASYSNYGSLIDVSAPGGDSPDCTTLIVSTGNGGTTTQASENYKCMAGTSMAAPHVAGLVALMQSAAPSPLTPAAVETTLKNTARALPGSCSGGCGAGIVDANAAVAAVGGGGPGNQAPTANFGSSVNGLTVSFTDTSSDSDGSIASRSWNFGDGTSSTSTNPSKTYSQAGTYNVTLTVTDDDGATDSETKSVTVSGGGGGGSVLQDGVPVTGISGASGSQQFWTMNVPAGASNLVFQTSGGSGDADMYVRFGSAPTTSSYNCRPYRNGNNETCTFSSPQAGTYHVMLRGYSSFSGVSLVGSYDTGGGGGGSQTYTNGSNVTISDHSTVESPIPVSGRSGNAGSSVPVAVNIVHTYRGDLKVDLVAPDGSVYVLHNRTGGSANNINATYNVNLSSESLNGSWRLRVNDNWSGDTGYINSWSVTF